MKPILTLLLCTALMAGSSLQAFADHSRGGKNRGPKVENTRGGRDNSPRREKSKKKDKDQDKKRDHSKGDKKWDSKKDKKDRDYKDYRRDDRHDRYDKPHKKDYYNPKPPKKHDNGNHYGWRKPPKRPHRPNCYHSAWKRPPMPHGWNPRNYRGPSLGQVLGLTFGIVLDNALDRLASQGYYVDGYENDMVFLRNVPMMNYTWPDATLYYGNNGFRGSSFYYSTPGRNLSRWNALYNYCQNYYGRPASYYAPGNSFEATWFTGQNGFITLNFSQQPTPSGPRYFTTLSVGN